ncbi:hypothetical protein OAV77_01265 [Candidatus Marinimicrobia bacterium]|nr:hypothetical protein [Candidatus Neomarinimicrobiota bacterium]
MINVFIFLFIIMSPMYAYIGPGMSGGLIATILGIIGSIFLAIFGILYYPIKRFIKNRKKK